MARHKHRRSSFGSKKHFNIKQPKNIFNNLFTGVNNERMYIILKYVITPVLFFLFGLYYVFNSYSEQIAETESIIQGIKQKCDELSRHNDFVRERLFPLSKDFKELKSKLAKDLADLASKKP